MSEQTPYRKIVDEKDLINFEVKIKETNLLISAKKNLKEESIKIVKKYRKDLEDYIKCSPIFQESFVPIPVEENDPEIVKIMKKATKEAQVGPMASVAGTIAELVGKELLNYTDEVIVENGGDIFLKTLKERKVGVFAGTSMFSYKIALIIYPDDTPLGICTSSGTVGHSFSFGYSDAVVVVSLSTPLSDAFATAIGNIIKDEEDIENGLNLVKKFPKIKGVLIIKGEKIGVWGDIKLAYI